LRCVAVCASLLRQFLSGTCFVVMLVCYSVLQCVAVCCGVLQCVVLCCSVLLLTAPVLVRNLLCCHVSVLQYVAVRCSVLQCVAVCCSVLLCVALYYASSCQNLLCC